MVTVDEGLLNKVAARIAEPPGYAADGLTGSLLTVAAAAYSSGARSVEDVTQPTGFDPQAAALFEAVLESAFLVANSDGHFDAIERGAFRHVILTACQGRVSELQIDALLADLSDQLEEDGLSKRIEMVAKTIQREDHAKEVLRIAALLARVSSGVSAEERQVLERLSDQFGLDRSTVPEALAEVEQALSSQ
ncbi:MAG: hypothetical protein RJA70_2043 [Pseudomonadota bacterium]|jgi:tellurite resistance protein